MGLTAMSALFILLNKVILDASVNLMETMCQTHRVCDMIYVKTLSYLCKDITLSSSYLSETY